MNKTPDNENEVKAVLAKAYLSDGRIDPDRIYSIDDPNYSHGIEVMITPIASESKEATGIAYTDEAKFHMAIEEKIRTQLAQKEAEIERLNGAHGRQMTLAMEAANEREKCKAENERLHDSLNEECKRVDKLNEELLLSGKLREEVEEKLVRSDNVIGYIAKYGKESGISRVVQVCEMHLKGMDLNPMRTQPIEPTVAESARVQVSADECLEWLFDHEDKECIYMCKTGDRYIFKYRNNKKGIYMSLFGDSPLEAIRSAMANEGKKE